MPADLQKNEKTPDCQMKEGMGCPWLSPPALPVAVELGEATYIDLYMEVAQKAWLKAAWVFPAATAWPPASVFGRLFGTIFVQRDMAGLLTKGLLPWPEIVDILVDAVLGLLEGEGVAALWPQ